MSLQDASIPSKASVYVWASPPTHLLLEHSCQTGPKGMLVLFLKQHQSMMLVQRQSIPVSELEGPPSSFTQRGSAFPPAPPGRGLGRGLPCNVSRWTRCWADIKRLSFGVSCATCWSLSLKYSPEDCRKSAAWLSSTLRLCADSTIRLDGLSRDCLSVSPFAIRKYHWRWS